MTTVANENEIRCELVLKAPIEKVFWALTTPEGWTGWFSQEVSGKFAVGEKLELDFGPYGMAYAIVSEMDRPNVFAYKWHPGDGADIDGHPENEMTTVRFTLEAVPEGTKLLMQETGFGNLPEARRISALRDNSSGWGSELPKIVALVESDTRQPALPYDIFRERVVEVPIQAAWNALATPEGLSSWFLKSCDGDLEVGSIATFHFSIGVSGPVKIVERQEPNVLVWKWHPGEVDGCTWDKYPEDEATTVRFELSETDRGTMIIVMESGFANIPEPRRGTALGLNKKGLSTVMDWLRDYLAKQS